MFISSSARSGISRATARGPTCGSSSSAAVGTPQLSDAKGDIARHFVPDREIVLYTSLAELRERASALLADEPLRRSIAAAARARALRDHTWALRLQELLTTALP